MVTRPGWRFDPVSANASQTPAGCGSDPVNDRLATY